MYFILLILLLISLLFKCHPLESNSNIKQNIQSLIRQTSRWSVASQQDSSTFIANLHANYGVGYLSALTDIYTQQQIELYGDIDLKKFANEIISIQDTAARKLISDCPQISAPNKFLAELAGE